jgi:hypothetical protein
MTTERLRSVLNDLGSRALTLAARQRPPGTGLTRLATDLFQLADSLDSLPATAVAAASVRLEVRRLRLVATAHGAGKIEGTLLEMLGKYADSRDSPLWWRLCHCTEWDPYIPPEAMADGVCPECRARSSAWPPASRRGASASDPAWSGPRPGRPPPTDQCRAGARPPPASPAPCTRAAARRWCRRSGWPPPGGRRPHRAVLFAARPGTPAHAELPQCVGPRRAVRSARAGQSCTPRQH